MDQRGFVIPVRMRSISTGMADDGLGPPFRRPDRGPPCAPFCCLQVIVDRETRMEMLAGHDALFPHAPIQLPGSFNRCQVGHVPYQPDLKFEIADKNLDAVLRRFSETFIDVGVLVHVEQQTAPVKWF